MIKPILYIFLPLLICLQSCLSFKGITIPPEMESFHVTNFVDRSNSAIPNLDIEFTTILRDKIRQNSRLVFNENEPDVSFEGEISRFAIENVSPTADNQVDYNKLVIKVKVRYYSDEDPDIGFDRVFEHFEQFPASQLLVDVQDQLVETIFDQIAEQVFNEAFTNW